MMKRLAVVILLLLILAASSEAMVARPAMFPSVSAIDFGTVGIHDKSLRSFQITNVGGGILTVTIEKIPWIKASPAVVKIPAGQSRTINLTAYPEHVGYGHHRALMRLFAPGRDMVIQCDIWVP